MPDTTETATMTLTLANPFDSKLARANSSYAAFQNNTLVFPLEPDQPPSPLMEYIHDILRASILSKRFPCVGAKSAMNRNTYRIGLYSAMNTPGPTAGLARDLFTFVQEQPHLEGPFTTFIAIFTDPYPTSELHLEQLLWQQLQSLHELDAPLHPWDPSVSSNPTHPTFSFSFATRAFFIVGLSPASSRWSRRFPWPTLVFNARHQFEQLRQHGTYYSIQSAIRTRDHTLQGTPNPSLANFGEQSEARQYAGRPVQPDWQCPFHPHTTGP